MPILFLRNIRRGALSIEDADEEQGKLIKKLSNINKGGRGGSKKESFIINIVFFLEAREKFLTISKLIKQKIQMIFQHLNEHLL